MLRAEAVVFVGAEQLVVNLYSTDNHNSNLINVNNNSANDFYQINTDIDKE